MIRTFFFVLFQFINLNIYAQNFIKNTSKDSASGKQLPFVKKQETLQEEE